MHKMTVGLQNTSVYHMEVSYNLNLMSKEKNLKLFNKNDPKLT